MSQINLLPTRQLHEQLADRWHTAPNEFAASYDVANQALRSQGIMFEGKWNLATALTALLLDDASQATLRDISERLCRLTERALDWIIASPERLKRFFPDHRRMFPFLCKTAGLHLWQGYCRYDTMIATPTSVRNP